MEKRDCIEVSNSKMLKSDYIEHEIQKASALLQFRNPNCKIVVEEQDNKIIVKAVEKTTEEKEEEKANKTKVKFSNENNILKVKTPEGDER